MNQPIPLRISPLAAVALFALPLPSAWADFDLPALEKLEQQVHAVAEKDMPAVVAITYDSKFGIANGTGAVISPQGLVLTAAHVVNDQNELDVVFPDGKRVHAKVLGANYALDVALVQITVPGTYASVELGDTKDLAVGGMVVAMGHAEQFDPRRKPPVRFGRVFAIARGQQIQSDAIITHGDSGGPLFDLEGKLIGVNVSKRDALTSNFATSVDVVRKNWDRLLKGERWGRNPLPSVLSKAELEELEGLDLDQFHARTLKEYENSKRSGNKALDPQAIGTWLKECGMKEEKITAMSNKAKFTLVNTAVSGISDEANELQTAPAAVMAQDDQMARAVQPSLAKLSPSVVSMVADGKPLATGTIIRDNGYILTKHSAIAKAKGELKARLADGREFTGKEVRQFAEHDLALVKIAADGLPALALAGPREPLELGQFLFSPGSSTTGAMLAKGVVSVTNRSFKREGGAYLGASHVLGKDGVEVAAVAPDGPAAKTDLMVKDRVLTVNDQPVTQADAVGVMIRAMAPDSKIRIKFRRGDEEKTIEVTLGDRSKLPGVEVTGNTGTAWRGMAAEFPLVFQNDQPLKPNQCGGVIADLHGQVVGVNIARSARECTLAIPAATVAELLKGVDFESLAK